MAGQKNIKFVLNGNETAHKAFIRKYVRRTSAQFQNYWRNMLFTGQAALPKTLKQVDKVVEFVQTTEGAISYIDSSVKVENVKIISVK